MAGMSSSSGCVKGWCARNSAAPAWPALYTNSGLWRGKTAFSNPLICKPYGSGRMAIGVAGRRRVSGRPGAFSLATASPPEGLEGGAGRPGSRPLASDLSRAGHEERPARSSPTAAWRLDRPVPPALRGLGGSTLPHPGSLPRLCAEGAPLPPPTQSGGFPGSAGAWTVYPPAATGCPFTPSHVIAAASGPVGVLHRDAAGLAAYLACLRKSGLRFSLKARTPSFDSSLA